MPKIDLHLHSNYSDGKLSMPELAKLVKLSGLRYCSLTDHDTVAGTGELEKCLQGSDITAIPGVELTALYGANEIHILAYDFDVQAINEILRERSDLVKIQKIEEMAKLIDLFNQEGFKITANLTPVEKKPVGYTLAMDICQQQFNQDLFIKRHGKIPTSDDIYSEYTAPGKPCAVKKSGVSVDWLLGKLKDSVFDFIIAHPFLQATFVAKPLSEDDIFSLLSMGLSGLEVYHDKISSEKIQWLKKIVNDKNLHYTGGSDFHGNKNDLELGHYGLDLEIPNFKITNYKSV
jgi:predicted metal-dependent phosphoesterase TrpH